MIGIGELIRINREERKLSQEDLCFGICSTSNLSKIENGTQFPTRATFEALMQRMGLSADIYPSFLDGKDKKAYELKYDINDLYSKGMYDEAEKKLAMFEKLPKLDNVYNQFIVMTKILLKQQMGQRPEETVKEFENIISMYIKDFSSDKIRKCLLTKSEINMLNAYAIANHRAGNEEIAIDILYGLVDYIDRKVYDKESTAIMYTKLISNLSKYVGMSGDDKEAIRLCDIGITYCIRYSRHTYFAHILYIKGYGLMNLGQVDEAHKCIQECYYIERAMGGNYTTDLEVTKRFAEKNGIKLL
ncbi:MAG: helix-turn-helix domain-containing protein [Defluviitaleaceae bacterium]|nr:helix-turn-helix domain-containing protein [Defluviitaleaceae bacterium]